METRPPRSLTNAHTLSPARHSTCPLPRFAVSFCRILESIVRADRFTASPSPLSAPAAGQRPALRPEPRTPACRLVRRSSKSGGGSLGAGRARPQHQPGELCRSPDGTGLPPGCKATGRQGSPGTCTANPRPGRAHPHRHTGTRCRLAIPNCHMYGSDPIALSTDPMGALQSTHQPVTQPDRPSHGLDLIASQKQTSICQLFRCDPIGFPPIQRWATSGRDAQARRGERRTQRCVPTSRGLEPAHAFFRHASPRLASHEPGVGPASAGDTSGTRRRIGPPDPAGVAEAHHTDHACRPPNRHAPQCRACLKRQLPNVDMRP